MRLYIALENIRSLNNVGAIMRTSAFFGIKDVILVGISGVLDMGAHRMLNPKVSKTSLKAEKELNIIFLESSSALVDYAQQNTLDLIAIEQHSDSISLDDFVPTKDSVLVFGHERDGVSQKVLESADKIVDIPRSGNKNSLNVATAAGVVIYKLTSIFE